MSHVVQLLSEDSIRSLEGCEDGARGEESVGGGGAGAGGALSALKEVPVQMLAYGDRISSCDDEENGRERDSETSASMQSQ
mmetsp:Transcript_14788/g.17993  ORF Transcript_14788/g.17993 Transcript_14788/m.17993 type:complete len:81 (+) Transcript_14788:53-295(+)